jgi:hypothetical protein
LSAGYQIAQIAHVVADYMIAHPNAAKNWHDISNSIIVLEAPDARALSELQDNARDKGLTVTEFREPDLADEITALAFSPSDETKRFLSNLRLAGRKQKPQQSLLDREHNLRCISFAMADHMHYHGQDPLQYGRAMREHYFALLEYLNGDIDLDNYANWRLPEWLKDNKEAVLAGSPSRYVMDRYFTFKFSGLRSRLPSEAYAETYGEEADPEVISLLNNRGEYSVLAFKITHLIELVTSSYFSGKPVYEAGFEMLSINGMFPRVLEGAAV